MASLEWKKLLCTKRERDSSLNSFSNVLINSARNQFEADYDRIVGSSSVRRLQDKAQVFPLQENDIARTRLTHSMEVSALARSLGKTVGRRLEENHIFTREQTEELSALLQVAGLIHDLGNPPFGHYGETVIRNWFQRWFNSDTILATHNVVLTSQQKNDFIYFDGNVQNLRIVTKLQVQNDTKGANFTYGTLAAIMKYPWSSESVNCTEKKNKKFGYFKSEEELAKRVRDEIGLNDGVRHPATHLLEAADDIIYICDDIEDGAKKGYIDWNREFECLLAEANKGDSKFSEGARKLLKAIDEKNNKIDKKMHEKEKTVAKIRNFRNMTQSYLFKIAVNEFLDNYDAIMSNDSAIKVDELLEVEKEFTKTLREITAEYCFSSPEVLNLELAGDKVISTLLDIFIEALTENTGKDLSETKTYGGKLFRKISRNFIYISESEAGNEDNDKGLYAENAIDKLTLYDRLHLVVDYISGMTDSYAVKIYQELTAMKHP